MCDFFFIIEFQNCGSEYDHGLLWIKDAPIYGINTYEELKFFVDKYISCNLMLLPITLQNAQQHQHTQTYKQKNHVVYRFQYPLPPMSKTTILKPLESKENLPFSKNYLQQQATKVFEF